MNFTLNYLLLVLMVLFVGCSKKVDESLKYLKQNPPSTVTEIFAPGLISKESEYEFGSVFNKDGKYFFYTNNEDIYWVNAKIIERLRR